MKQKVRELREDATRATQGVTAAYEVLGNAERRAAYDSELIRRGQTPLRAFVLPPSGQSQEQVDAMSGADVPASFPKAPEARDRDAEREAAQQAAEQRRTSCW